MAQESSPLPPAVVFRGGTHASPMAHRAGAHVVSVGSSPARDAQDECCARASRLSLSLDEPPAFGAPIGADVTIGAASRSFRDFLQPRAAPNTAFPEQHGAPIVILSSEDAPSVSHFAQPERPPPAINTHHHITALVDQGFSLQCATENISSEADANTSPPVATETCTDLVAALQSAGVAAAPASLGHPAMVAWSASAHLVPHALFYMAASEAHARCAESPERLIDGLVCAASSRTPSPRIVLVIVGARSYAASLEAAARRAFRQRLAAGERLSSPGGADAWLRAADDLWHAALDARVHVHHIDADRLAGHIAAAARAVAAALDAAGSESLGFSARDAPRPGRTPADAWTRMLAQVPRVTQSSASCIAARFPTLSSLVAAGEEALRDVVLENGRPVGPVLAARIFRCLLSSSDQPAF